MHQAKLYQIVGNHFVLCDQSKQVCQKKFTVAINKKIYILYDHGTQRCVGNAWYE